LLPSEFGNGHKLPDGIFIHALGIINGELISGHTLVDVTRSAHARDIGDTRERGTVNSHTGSTVKWDGTSSTALEVICSIDTLVGLSELRVTEDPTGGVTLITQDTPLPFICTTLVRNLTGAAVGASTYPVALLHGGIADTFSAALSVSIRTVEVTRILLVANRSGVVGVVAAASTFLYFISEEIHDFPNPKDRGSIGKNVIGLDKVGNLRKACTLVDVSKVCRLPISWVGDRN